MTIEVEAFAKAIGASTPESGSDLFKAFRQIFKRPNYFLLNRRLLIVKISRSRRPFWGLSKDVIDFANNLNDYCVVLLTSESEGWYFRKADVNSHIRNLRWGLSEAQGQYKINFPLPDGNSFYGPEQFLIPNEQFT